MIYRLIVLTGPLKGQRITVDPEPMVIGRQESCDIQLPDNEVALNHARLEHRGDELFIRDLGSMNKVILNKREVQETRLKHGDILELGRTRLLVQAIVQAEVCDAPAPVCLARRARRSRLVLAIAALLVIGLGIRFWTSEPAEASDPTTAAQATADAAPSPAEPAATPELAPQDWPAQDPNLAALPEPELAPALDVAPPTPAPPIDNELRQIREDLSFIQQHLQNLNASAQPLATERTPATPPSINDLEATMTAVRDALQAGEFNQADLMLEHIQLEYPDYLPAYETRARLFEEWGMPGKAREQWTAILQRTTESELYRKAVVERIRLGRSDSQRQISAHDAVRIESIEQIRFQETADYDEMRMVKIVLSYDRSLGPIDPEGVRLLVYFFEQDLDTSRIELSKLQPYTESKLNERQNESGDQFRLSASYVVPKGYYQRDQESSRQRYFGFIARLHYFDRLVDEQARPPKLLEPAILEAAGLAVHTAGHRSDDQLKPATN
ncbi:MAG TPA: FHA domain-containing protein [Kiritimatiellia bacterium]|nr:FHA domain-containing protein [Kiritimatiellia bacterium]HMP34512.1 FHA domain-containing protein [Kiritimatiellia bacterium]